MMLSYLTGRRNVHDSPWTVARDALLAQLWAEGYSASQIADQITDVKVSRMAVIGRAHRLNLPPRQARKRSIRPDGRRPRVFVPKPPAPPPRPQPPPPPPGAPKMRRLKLVDLKPHHCRWPIGDAPFFFCAADAHDGDVYCPAHMRMARVRRKDDG
jgi:GcrA cell cycle regulator